MFITTSTYSNEAKEFAAKNNITLIDGDEFLKRIEMLSLEHQQELLTSATWGDYTTPSCPKCGIKLVNRKSKIGHNPFWGCRRYPVCRFTMRIAKAT